MPTIVGRPVYGSQAEAKSSFYHLPYRRGRLPQDRRIGGEGTPNVREVGTRSSVAELAVGRSYIQREGERISEDTNTAHI